jgi:hypothetical protein
MTTLQFRFCFTLHPLFIYCLYEKRLRQIKHGMSNTENLLEQAPTEHQVYTVNTTKTHGMWVRTDLLVTILKGISDNSHTDGKKTW